MRARSVGRDRIYPGAVSFEQFFKTFAAATGVWDQHVKAGNLNIADIRLDLVRRNALNGNVHMNVEFARLIVCL